jgi:hypothetical protein
MQRTPWALAATCLWLATLQSVRAEPASTKLVMAKPAARLDPPPTAAAPLAQSARHALERSTPEWRADLAALPELRRYANSFATFGAAATDEALARGKRNRSNIKAWEFVDGPFAWTVSGRVLWIVAGKTEHGALLSVLAPSSAGPQHRCSTLIAEPDAVIAVGLSTERPNELLWTTCYGCPGQSGSIALAADGRPSFGYR